MLVCVKHCCSCVNLLDTDSMELITISVSVLPSVINDSINLSGSGVVGVNYSQGIVRGFDFDSSRLTLGYLGINPREYGL